MEATASPIIISGFGRSGTTWLSDIISKSLGGLILFEPFHPKVFPEAKCIPYAKVVKSEMDMAAYWIHIHEGGVRSKWLLRNHLRSPYEETPETYVDSIWENCSILGFKTIRANHMLADLYSKCRGRKLVHIIRHPLACLASIQRRPEFWEEFGWEWHWKTFLARISMEERQLAEPLSTVNQKIIFMWAQSQQEALKQVAKMGGIITSYEALYLNPFGETRRILSYLGTDRDVHPSYLFEPSMTSMRTFHNSASDYHVINHSFPSFFWEDILSVNESKELLHMIKDLPVNRPEILRYLNL